MPPRLQMLPSQLHTCLTRHPQFTTLTSLILPQTRNAHILASISDNPGAYNKRIRKGRGPASGKGKTAGRGHKGQKARGKVPAGFNGGQTPLEIVRGKRGFRNAFTPDLATINLDRLQSWIDQGRIDPQRPITIRELADSRCVHGTGDGAKLLAHSSSALALPDPSSAARSVLKQPIHVVVSRASAAAISAVEAAGGSVTTRYYTRSAIARIMRREMHPFLSMAWSTDSTSSSEVNEKLLADIPADTPTRASGSPDETAVMKAMKFRYRLPDPTSRRDIEYYRDPAHRGYLSHLLKPLEGPSLFFQSPLLRKTTTGQKKEKVLPENRLW